MKTTSTKIKILSLAIISFFVMSSVLGAYFATRISASYEMDQFLPSQHPLLTADQQSKKVFQISEFSPHIVLLSFPADGGSRWFQKSNLQRLKRLSSQVEALAGVNSVISLGNIASAFESKDQLIVGQLDELQEQGFKAKRIANSSLYTPHLMSKDGLHAALFVIPTYTEVTQSKALMAQVETLASQAFPQVGVKIGGPAAIRTQLMDLLSKEITLFILLALLCAIIVLKIMFRSYAVLLQALFVLVAANLASLGVMGWLGISFNILSSTMPIIVTVSALGVFTHLLVRMSEASHLSASERLVFLIALVREITPTVLLTGISTCIGFACLMNSDVQVITEYGKAVSIGVFIACLSALVLTPSLYVWLKWPMPRNFLLEPKRFALFLVQRAKILVPAVFVSALVIASFGFNLSWTARLFDDLPNGHQARQSTDLISDQLGGVVTLDVVVGGDKLNSPWKQPANIRKLDQAAKDLRKNKQVGSVLTLADFLNTGGKHAVPKSRAAIAEIHFLYELSGSTPLKQFVSTNEKWTRLQIRLPDLPEDESKAIIGTIETRLQKAFPKMDVNISGMAAVVPHMNSELSKKLMWGFFEALFWIVLVLAISFGSLRWALVSVLPNLVPPAILMGFLALFNVPIKPGIAIIFSISLGIAFDNTIYIMGRLKHLLKTRPRQSSLPVYLLMKKETMPCLVSSLCLFAGFSIFMFSVFPVNKMFGLFVLLSIVAGLLGDLVFLPALMKRYPWLLLETPAGGKINQPLPFQFRETAVKLSPYIVLIALGMVAFRSSYASGAQPVNVEKLLKTVEEKAAPPNERVELKMVISESDGSKKERELSILRKNEGKDGARALVRIHKPSDLDGLSLLTIAKGTKEDQWLYLPSDKKSRRILGSNKKGKFLDSEIAFEDMAMSAYREFANKIIKDDGKIIQVESKANAGSESSYGRLMTWISKANSRVEKVEYYDKAGKLLKRAQFKGYSQVGGKYWRAKVLEVHNVQSNRKTQLIVKKVSLKKIGNDEVSLAALED